VTVAVGFEDIACLEENLAQVHIKALEQLPELFVLIRIVDQALAASKTISMLCPLAKRSRSIRSSVVAVLRPGLHEIEVRSTRRVLE